MPGGDRTGPMGRGALTGWGRGICGGSRSTRFQGGGYAGGGRGFGRGAGGGGRGWRNQFRATGLPGWRREGWAPPGSPGVEPAADTEQLWLRRRAAELEAEQKEIKARIAELEA
jgi:hypothetical protein